jgi:uncharacterized protein YacL
MYSPVSYTKIFFMTLGLFFLGTQNQDTLSPLLLFFLSLLFIATLLILDSVFKKVPIRKINTITLGLFFGSLLGLNLLPIFLAATKTILEDSLTSVVETSLMILTSYIGLVATMRASEELYISIPFFKFKPSEEKRKNFLLDHSILSDTRLLEIVSSGLFDNLLILPRFVIKDLYDSLENSEDLIRTKAKRGLDLVKKLESLPELNLRYSETDFPDIKDSTSKIVHLARLLNAQILTVDINRVQQSSIEGVRIINLNMLSNTLKPLTQATEYLSIKIQRYGKEPLQGVGYLEDGSMVVVNGGAAFIGETIKTQVLSVKQTSSGRMIFCNAFNEENGDFATTAPQEHSSKNYFAL